jgi:hypothetical protein
LRRSAIAKRKANQAKEAVLLAQSQSKKPKDTPIAPHPDYLPAELVQTASESFGRPSEEGSKVKQLKKKRKKVTSNELQEGAAIQLE